MTDEIRELKQRVAFLVAEAHGWQPKLQAAVEERDRIRSAAEWLIANRGHRGEAQAWKLLAAQMGHPIPGDSCMGAFIGLVLMEYLDGIAAPTKEDTDE